MSTDDKKAVGSIGWVDLTVPDAEKVREFYSRVIGWGSQPLSMGDYDDYCMMPPGQEAPVAGVCHARGPNAALPPQWLIYVKVADLDRSLGQAVELGGKIIAGPKDFGPDTRYAVVQDPAGACLALYSEGS